MKNGIVLESINWYSQRYIYEDKNRECFSVVATKFMTKLESGNDTQNQIITNLWYRFPICIPLNI